MNTSATPTTAPTANPTSSEQPAYSDAGWTEKEPEPTQGAAAEQPAQSDVEALFGQAREHLLPYFQRGRQMVKDHPVLALGTGIGVLLATARLLRHRK